MSDIAISLEESDKNVHDVDKETATSNDVDYTLEENILHGEDNIIDARETEWIALLASLSIDIEKEVSSISEDDIQGKSFTSIDHAFSFYTIYSKKMGFSIRKKIKRSNSKGVLTRRSWICSGEGFREEKYVNMENRSCEPRSVTRTGCAARFQINFCPSDNLWNVASFIAHHNHPLALPHQQKFLRSHRKVSEAILTKAMSMKMSGVPIHMIWQHFLDLFGGFDKIGFIKPDLYRSINNKYAEWDTIDTKTGMQYISDKIKFDVEFFFSHTTDDEQRLSNLFWADGAMRTDYQLFGDCLSFDATYKTNRYQKPLVILLGSNNHDKTCFFGLALLENELAESYTWLLNTFLECMSGCTPKTVLTDGCRSMSKAIDNVMPSATHRICSWHILKNVGQHIHNTNFIKEFRKLIFRYYTEEEWQHQWDTLLKNYDMVENDWLKSLHETRKLWADSFLRGHYFGGCTATGRCEGINSAIKKSINKKSPLWMFFKHLDTCIASIRQNEMKEDYDSTMTEPLLNQTTMPIVEEQVATIFTREIYRKFIQEIRRADHYVVLRQVETEDNVTCDVAKYTRVDPKRTVVISHNREIVNCDCYWFQTKGVPCRHIFSTMKNLNISNLPSCLVNNRFLKDAKMIDTSALRRKYIHPNVVEYTRYGGVMSAFIQVANKAMKSTQHFRTTMALIHEMERELDAIPDTNEGQTWESSNTKNELSFDINDPKIVKTKGRPTASQTRAYQRDDNIGPTKKLRYCKLCKGPNHDSRNCPTKDK